MQHRSDNVTQTVVSWPAGTGFKSRPDIPWRTLFTKGSRRFFAGVSLYIINLARRIRKAAKGGGTRSAPIFFLKSLKRKVRAAHGRAPQLKSTSLSYILYHVTISNYQGRRFVFSTFVKHFCGIRLKSAVRNFSLRNSAPRSVSRCQENIRVYL